MALLYGRSRTSTIRSRTACELFVISQQDFKRLVLREAAGPLAEVGAVLKQSKEIGALPKAERKALALALRPFACAAGDTLLRQGDPPTAMYVVMDGEVFPWQLHRSIGQT